MNYQQTIYNAAISRGLNPATAKLFLAQVMHETGNFQSRAFKLDNNPGGYTWTRNSKYKKGIQRPTAEGGNYVHFPTLREGVNAMLDLLEKKQHTAGYTLNNLTTPQAYADALKAANYYTDTVANYAHGLQARLKEIGKNLQTGINPQLAMFGAAVAAFVIIKNIQG